MRSRLFMMVGLLWLVSACVTDDGDNYKKYYTKYYGTDGDQQAADMIVNPDGTIIIIGTSEFPANSNNTKTYIVKVGADGKVIWEKTYGDGVDFAQDIEAISGGYVILSNINLESTARQFKLTLIDDNGIKTDSLVYDSLADQYGESVTPVSGGGYYVAGRTFDTDLLYVYDDNLPVPEVEDLLYVHFFSFDKTDADVDRIGQSTTGSAIKVFETSPGVHLTCEYSNQLITSEPGIDASEFESNFVLRVFNGDPKSTDGSILYAGNPAREEMMSQSVVSADGYFYTIGTSSVSGGASSAFLMKARKAVSGPSKIFENSFAGSSLLNVAGLEGVSVVPNIGYCYVLANAISQSDGTRDIWITRVNAFDGEQDAAWINGFMFGTSSNDDIARRVAEAPNGDILILGTMNLTNQRKIALIRLSPDGEFAP